MLWFRRKPKLTPGVPLDPVVEEAKRRTHAAADEVTHSAAKLNSQFAENHITLTILRTAGGGKHGR